VLGYEPPYSFDDAIVAAMAEFAPQPEPAGANRA
jgi:hypothetical protein